MSSECWHKVVLGYALGFEISGNEQLVHFGPEWREMSGLRDSPCWLGCAGTFWNCMLDRHSTRCCLLHAIVVKRLVDHRYISVQSLLTPGYQRSGTKVSLLSARDHTSTQAAHLLIIAPWFFHMKRDGFCCRTLIAENSIGAINIILLGMTVRSNLSGKTWT